MNSEERMNDRIARALHMKVRDYAKFDDGFSFTVATELEAYKAAHKYSGVKHRVRVTEAPNVGRWLVQVFIETLNPIRIGVRGGVAEVDSNPHLFPIIITDFDDLECGVDE